MRDMDFSGVVAASLTPVTQTFDIDAARLCDHVSSLLEDDCDFVSTFGTTGEGASFSTRQKADALKAMAAANIDMSRLIPGVISPTIDDAAQSIDAAARLGCSAALLLPPFYYPAEEPGIAAFYDAVFDRTDDRDVPIILYNIPDFSGATITPSLIETLVKRHGARIGGVKDSTGDRDNGVMLAKAFPDLSVFTGDDRVLPDLLEAGGAGLIGGMPNLFAKDIVTYFRAPHGPDAPRLIQLANARIDVVDSGEGLAALKAMMAVRHDDPTWRRVMPPLEPLSGDAIERVVQAFVDCDGPQNKAVA